MSKAVENGVMAKKKVNGAVHYVRGKA